MRQYYLKFEKWQTLSAKLSWSLIIELKITEFKAEYVGQLLKYMGYVDNHLKEGNNEKTLGIIICKENNDFVLKYIGLNNILTTTYLLQTI